jgi:hypothetical protein
MATGGYIIYVYDPTGDLEIKAACFEDVIRELKKLKKSHPNNKIAILEVNFVRGTTTAEKLLEYYG